MNCTPVFHANYTSTANIVIDQGGTSSSKTYSIMQVLCLYAVQDPGQIITVTGESLPNLRKGAYRDAEHIYNNNAFIRERVSFWNQAERIIYFKNGSLIEFATNVDEQSAKAGKRDYLFVNEANGVDWGIFFQLAMRTRKRVYIDYNPTAPFWAHEKLIGTTHETNDLHATVQLIISDHRHNPFLSQAEHNKIEGIKDPHLHRVYARGMTGNLVGLIYPTWRQIPDAKFPWDHDKLFGGLDFGYTNDPTAGVICARIDKSVFVHQVTYKTGVDMPAIATLFKARGFNMSTPLYCEHDAGLIRELRLKPCELLSIPARKGPGSVKSGILKVNEYQVFYTASSTDLAEERRKYMWMKDPVTGKPTNVPVEGSDHLMDAVRYAIHTHFWRAA